MAVLISIVLALLFAAFTALALLATVLLVAVLALLVLLATDLLLERNGVDRRSAVQGAWRTLRGAGHPTPPQEDRANGDAPTEVLPVTGSTAAPRTTRAARPTRAPRTAGPRSQAAPAPGPKSGAGLTTSAADRSSAIDRLFAPLTESDSTEPLPSPGATRPKRPAD